MERKKIKVFVGRCFETDRGENEISKLAEWVKSVIEEGATHLTFNAYSDSDHTVEEFELNALYYREETDNELNARADKENLEKLRAQKSAYEYNKREYERLKKIFEKE